MIDTNLTNLLVANQSNPIAADCLERISQGDELRIGADCLLPIAHTVDIYSTRARINAKRGGMVEGYDELLPALKSASVSSVRLYSLEFLSHWFVVFTDDSSSNLFGVLRSPKKKEAWYDPSKGYDEYISGEI